MSFFLKTFSEITNEIVTSLRMQESTLLPEKASRADLGVGSRLAVLISGVAAAISSGYISLAEMRRIFYVASSSGPDLDRRLADFGMTRNTGFTAFGNVIISHTSDVVLPIGTLLSTLDDSATYSLVDGIIYSYESPIATGEVRVQATTNIESLSGLKTINQVDLLEGDRVLVSGQTITSENGVYLVSSANWTKVSPLSYATAPVFATDIGTRFNLPQGTLLKVVNNNSYPGIQIRVGSYLDLNGFAVGGISNGVDRETDSELRLRFPEFLKSFSRGTLFAVRQALLQIPGISPSNLAIQNAVPAPGWFTVNILNAGSEVPNEVKIEVGKKLEEWAAAGYGFQIKAIKQVTIPVQVRVFTTNPNVASISAQVERAIVSSLSGVLTFGKILYNSDIIAAAKSVRDVFNVEVITPISGTGKGADPGKDGIIVIQNNKPTVIVVYEP